MKGKKNTKTKAKTKTVFCVIVALLILAIIGMAVGIWYVHTNGGTEDFKTFYLMLNGKRIFAETSSEEFETDTTVRIDVRYTFDTGNKTRGYNVQILPNPEEDFEYTANGMPRAWSRAGELSEAFRLQKEEDYFTFEIGAVKGMRSFLKESLDLEQVTLPEGFDATHEFFILQVSSYNNTVIYNVKFSILFEENGASEADSVTTDRDGIVFYGYGGNEI